ncbi:YrbL family protein [Reinekea thalattae]|uniref:YrbL family protein n=1 Tax=Reinekea thalattae TaxID=2593301 RepID=UPI00164F732B|nr:YrbL family protein [Reinekea thalattae]
MYHSYLKLNELTPIAISRTRYIYEHPDNPELLVKVHRRIEISGPMSRLQHWYRNIEDRFIFLSGNLRELNIYFQSRYNRADTLVRYIAPIEGIVDTDLGLGLVVSAVRDKKGNLAPTIGKLFRENRMNTSRAKKLRALLEQIEKTDLVIGDLNFGNIVLEQPADGEEDFYLIDGLGEKTLFPIQTISRYARRKNKQTFITAVEKRLAEAGF